VNVNQGDPICQPFNKRRVIGRGFLAWRVTLPRTLRSWMFLLLPVTYVVQNPTLADYEDIASGGKPYHLIALMLFLFAAYRAPRRALVAALCYLIALLVSSVANFRIDARLVNAIGFLLVFVGASGARSTDMVWARRGAGVAAGFILIETFFHLPLILSSAADNVEGRPLYPTLLAGGINIEVSTLMILLGWASARYFMVVGGISVAVFLLTQTRSVFAIFPAALMARVKVVGGKRKSKASLLRRVLPYVVALALAAGLLASGIVDTENIATRLTNSFGDEPGSQGRILLYLVAFNASDCYLTGCGLGSAAEMISGSSISDFFEDNFHNVYIQQLVEVGVLGLLVYLALFWMALRGARDRLKDVGLGLAISTTFLMGFLQFNGYEFLTAFLLGLGFSGGPTKTIDHHLRQPS
jgi:O-antigen ligase